MKFKLKISKKLVLQLLLFAGIIAAANALDIYFDNNPVEIETAENESGQNADEHSYVYLFSQAGNSAVKTSIQRNQGRKLFEEHDKFLQRYHASKNSNKLKIKEKKPNPPLFLSYHHLLFRNCVYVVHDDDPHVS